MRRGDAKPRRAARLTTTANPPWSARVEPARVSREAQFPLSERKRSFRSATSADSERGRARGRRGSRGTESIRPGRARLRQGLRRGSTVPPVGARPLWSSLSRPAVRGDAAGFCVSRHAYRDSEPSSPRFNSSKGQTVRDGPSRLATGSARFTRRAGIPRGRLRSSRPTIASASRR